MDSEPPHSDRPPRRIDLRDWSLELVALAFASVAVVLVVVHQSFIGSPEIYRNRGFILVEVLAVLCLFPVGLTTLVKTIVLAFQQNKNAIVSLIVTIIIAAMFIFCFWYDASTLVYAT